MRVDSTVEPSPDLPPGPDLPPARQSSRWLTEPAEFLRALSEQHGDPFTVRLLREPPWVFSGDPGVVRDVLTAPADVLFPGEPNRIMEPVVGPRSVLVQDDETHMRSRRLLLPPFQASQLVGYRSAMAEVAAAEVERWPIGESLPALPRIGAIVLEVILRAVFGVCDERPEAESLRLELRRLVEYLARNARTVLTALADPERLREPRFAEFREAIEGAERSIYAELERRRSTAQEHPGEDVLSLLLAARYDDGSPMSDDELRDELMTLLIAGHETTTASLGWLLERLVRNPGALEQATAEAEAGGGPYVEAAVKETLRLRPPFKHLARMVKRPFELAGYELPPGVVVAIAIPVVHAHPELYPRPDAFLPERFLERPPGTYTWIPFGGGVRRCIGGGFAMLEMSVVLSTLLARFRPRPASDEDEREARRGLVMAPAQGARVVLEPR